jgi:hypothetical protein
MSQPHRPPTRPVLVDAPLIAALSSIGRWPSTILWIPFAAPCVSQNTPAELRELWSQNVAGTEQIDEAALTVLRVTKPDSSTAQAASLEWRYLSDIWRTRDMTAARAAGLATSFVTAVHQDAPFVTHDPAPWRASYASRRFNKVRLLGVVDCIIHGVRLGACSEDDAWNIYRAIAESPTGQQRGWRVGDGREKTIARVLARARASDD